MDGTAEAPFNVLSDTYNVWVPIEDTDLLKSVEKDENGDWVVHGVMTSDDKDEEDDSITPDGMDTSYFLTKGWIKYEHGNAPNQFIGEPLEVKVGRFEHPTLRKSVNGVYVKGRLFQNRDLAKQAVRAIQDLQKSTTSRRMGWSIEGNVKERCRTTGKIMKSVLRNVVLTMNPVNTTTWAELSKSFAKEHRVEIDMDKSLDTGSMAEVMPQSLEGAPKPVDDPQERWVRTFRKFVKDHALNRKLRKSFISGDPANTGMQAYLHARREGMEYDEALEFASALADRFDTLKSLFGKIGGDTMSKNALKNYAGLLDSDLEELQKSLESEELEDNLQKSTSKDKDKDKDSDDDDDDKGSDDNYEGDDEDYEDYEDDKGEEDDEDKRKDGGKTEKSLKSDFAKSFGAQDEQHAQALEVSDFLSSLVDDIGTHFDGFQKSMESVMNQQTSTVRALVSMGSLVKSLATELASVKSNNDELQKSLNEIMKRPVGRQSVVSTREVQTLTKSLGESGGERPKLTRSRVTEVLQKSFDAGNQRMGDELIRFDAGVPLESLRLTPEIKQELGLV